MAPPYSSRFQPVLGTELHLLLGCEQPEVAAEAESRVLEEIARLEALLSTYRPDTPLARWLRGELEDDPGPEAVAVLALAQHWFVASAGALHPGLGGVRRRWREAERTGRPPERAECRGLAEAARDLPFRVETSGGAQRVRRLGDCSDLDLDALAKGWVVDRAAEIAQVSGVNWVLVNIGGDLRLAGPGSVRVAVEDPRSSVDNAPPLATVLLTSGGLASSGSARRGFRVGDRWYGHVLDPRTGWPVEAAAGATVIAADTATADALATVVGVAGLTDAVRGLLARHAAAAMLVTASGSVELSDRWRDEVDFALAATG